MNLSTKWLHFILLEAAHTKTVVSRAKPLAVRYGSG